MNKNQFNETYKRRGFALAEATIESRKIRRPNGQETVDEFLARGGKVQKIPFGFSSKLQAEIEQFKRTIARAATS